MANTVKDVADSVSKLGIKSAYGEPVDIGGETVVPVAITWFGFGAGQETGDDESGTGGGGGGASIPVGVYVQGIDGPTFRPNLISLLAVSIPVIYVAGSALSKIVKALKK
jgi:uncharacterized spore protein YtfJ